MKIDKDNTSIVTACGMLVSGVVLGFFSFFLSADHEIGDSVLWYIAQTLIYAGSVFGLKSYIDYRLNK